MKQEEFNTPTDKQGYMFTFIEKDKKMQANSMGFQVAQWADNEKQALEMIREKLAKIIMQVNDRLKAFETPAVKK